MTWLLVILLIAIIIGILRNYFKSKGISEEIDYIRNSYIDLSNDLKEAREESAAYYHRLNLELLRQKGEVKANLVPYRINGSCIACGNCLEECPADAISEGDPIYVIDPVKCTACKKCASVCPVDACVPIIPEKTETE